MTLMDTMLLDTCVWLDTATSSEGEFLLSELAKLLDEGAVRLLLPEIVVAEVNRHKGTIADRHANSLRGRLKDAKEIVRLISSSPIKESVIHEIEEVRKAILERKEGWSTMVRKIEELLEHGAAVRLPTTDEVLLRAAQRGIEKRAPFNSGKNSTADAVIWEWFVHHVVCHDASLSSDRLIFVTHNTTEFSNRTDKRRPHPDLIHLFTTTAAVYCTNLAEALNSIRPGLVPAAVVDRLADERDAYPQCPHCYEGFLLPLGYERLPEGLVWHMRCENCGSKFSPLPDDHADARPDGRD